MKIKNLDQHCGECAVIGYCGNGWGYCLCSDARFSEADEETFLRIAEAEGLPPIKLYEACIGCTRPDCDVYRYSETDFADEACEHNDEARDCFCEQIADYVQSVLKSSSSLGEEKGCDCT